MAERDLWIASKQDQGRGFGAEALRRLARLLFEHPTVELLIARPSQRNSRSIRAFRKAGFLRNAASGIPLPTRVFHEGPDYADALVLVATRASLAAAFQA